MCQGPTWVGALCWLLHAFLSVLQTTSAESGALYGSGSIGRAYSAAVGSSVPHSRPPPSAVVGGGGVGEEAFAPAPTTDAAGGGGPAAAGWTLLYGSTALAQPPVYGAVGVPGASSPGCSWQGSSCSAADGLVAFGGLGFDMAGNYGLLNTIWLFNVSASAWTWLAGDPIVNPSNASGASPPGIGSAGLAADRSGETIYMFGGFWYPGTNDAGDPPGSAGTNMFWKFNMTSRTWTFLSGSRTNGNCLGSYNGLGSGGYPGCRSHFTLTTTSDDMLVLWGGFGTAAAVVPRDYLDDVWRYDPVAETWTWIVGSSSVRYEGNYTTKLVPGGRPAARCCQVTTLLSGNRLVLFGGESGSLFTVVYFNDVWLLDLDTLTYTWLAGSDGFNAVGSYGTPGYPGARALGGILGLDDQIALFGGFGLLVVPEQLADIPDAWVLDVSTGQWCLVCGGDTIYQVGSYSGDHMYPGARQDLYHAAYDGAYVFYGGYGVTNASSSTNLGVVGDVWIFSLGNYSFSPALDNCAPVTANCGVPEPGPPAALDLTFAPVDELSLWLPAAGYAAEGLIAAGLLLFSLLIRRRRRKPPTFVFDGAMDFSAGTISSSASSSAEIIGLSTGGSSTPEYIMTEEVKLLAAQLYGSGAVDWSIPLSELQVGRRIGTGEHGVVYKATCRGIECVVKSPSNLDDASVKTFLKECSRMQSIKPHPHVVRLFGVCAAYDQPPMLVMEFMDGGSLLDFLLDPFSTVDARMAVATLRDVASGMEHIHDAGFLHADLAARNVLLSRRGENLVAKVSDFGLSRPIESNTSYKMQVPIRWMAPEALLNLKRLTRQTDVYAFGVVMFEVLHRGLPFESLTSLQVYSGVVYKGLRLPRPTAVAHPDALFELLVRCTSHSPTLRPSFTDIHEELVAMFRELDSLGPSEQSFSLSSSSGGPSGEDSGTQTPAYRDAARLGSERSRYKKTPYGGGPDLAHAPVETGERFAASSSSKHEEGKVEAAPV